MAGYHTVVHRAACRHDALLPTYVLVNMLLHSMRLSKADSNLTSVPTRCVRSVFRLGRLLLCVLGLRPHDELLVAVHFQLVLGTRS